MYREHSGSWLMAGGGRCPLSICLRSSWLPFRTPQPGSTSSCLAILGVTTILIIGIKESANFNTGIVFVKLFAVLTFIAVALPSVTTVTPSRRGSTPATGASQTNSTPASSAAARSSCSVTTCGRLVAAGMTPGSGRRIRPGVDLLPAVERPLREPDEAVLGEPMAEPGTELLEQPHRGAVDEDRSAPGADPVGRARLDDRDREVERAERQRCSETHRAGADDDHSGPGGAVCLRARVEDHANVVRSVMTPSSETSTTSPGAR